MEENKRVKFRWFSSIDPAPTEVTVSFIEKSGSVEICLEHQVPDDSLWKEAAEGFRQNWVESLENLKSVLETGVDLRNANRPMLGILPGDFTEEQAASLNVPIREGLRLDGVVDGMGAQKCGLQRDDVIVEMVGHTITNDFNTLPIAISGKKGVANNLFWVTGDWPADRGGEPGAAEGRDRGIFPKGAKRMFSRLP